MPAGDETSGAAEEAGASNTTDAPADAKPEETKPAAEPAAEQPSEKPADTNTP
ncbi:MAG: hypothetical protein U0872_00895 [Planctomycetaceae bacterium]